MRAGAIHLAEHLIGDGTVFVLIKMCAVLVQHRGVSEAVVFMVTIQCTALTTR